MNLKFESEFWFSFQQSASLLLEEEEKNLTAMVEEEKLDIKERVGEKNDKLLRMSLYIILLDS